MNKAIGLALIAAGIILTIWGINASESLNSEVSRVFSGNPSDKSMWLTIGGIVSIVFGAAYAFLPRRGGSKT